MRLKRIALISAVFLFVVPSSHAVDGWHQWSKRLGGTSSDAAVGIVVDPSGNVVVAGSSSSPTIDLGGGPLNGFGSLDMILSSYSASGTHQWSKRLGDAGTDFARSTATDASGNVFVGGGSSSVSIDMGGGPLPGLGGSDVVLAKYSSSGAFLWSRRLGGATAEFPISIASDASGDLLVTGYSDSPTIDLGSGPLPSVGAFDLFVAKYSSSGAHQWSKRLGNTGNDLSFSIASDATGNVLVAGYSDSPAIDLGGGPLPGAGGHDLFMAKYSGSGAYQWSKRVGGFGGDYGVGIRADASGNVLFAAYSDSPLLDLGGGPLAGLGSYDILVAKFSASGAHQWSKRLGDTGSDIATLAADASGNVLLVGNSDSPSIDMGSGPLAGLGAADILVAEYSPSGAHQWSKRMGGTSFDFGNSIAAGQTGDVLVAATSTSPSIDLGGGPLAGLGSTDFVVAKYRVDRQAPASTFTSLPLAVTDPLPPGEVTGSITDDISGIDAVTVTFLSLTSGRITTVEAEITCNAGRLACTFRAQVPGAIGIYEVTAQVTDRAHNQASASTTLILV